MAVAVCEAVLGRPFLLSNISANITGPGGSRMHVHADQGYVADPWPPFPLAVNCAWLLTDFTAANGATRVVTGSHRLNRNPTPDELSRLQNDDTRSKPIEGPAQRDGA